MPVGILRRSARIGCRKTGGAVLALAILCWAAAAEGLEISREGGPAPSIIVPVHPDPWEAEAGRELSRVLALVTGVELSPVEEGNRGGGPAIHVGMTGLCRDLAIVPEALHPDGFVMVTRGDTLFLAGRNPWGTAFAVATLLEEVCGVRWYFPGPLGEIIPPAKAVRISSLAEVREPDFDVRDFTYAQVWGKDAPPKHESFRRWAWHNRVTAQEDSTGPFKGHYRHPTHSFFRLFPRNAREELPDEYFALVDGERPRPSGDTGWQLCTTNEDVIDELARRAREAFREDPGRPVFSVSPNDLGGFCECDRCREVDEGGLGTDLRRRLDGLLERLQDRFPVDVQPATESPLSERIFTMVAEVAHRAPEAVIGCYAYADYRAVPRRVSFPSNVEIWFAQFSGTFADPARRSETRRALREWIELEVPLYVYEYYGHIRARVPRLFPHLIAEDLRHLHESGVRGVHAEATCDWALHGLNYYLAAQFLWDVDQDVYELLREYEENLFGPAADPMGEYLRLLEEGWREASRRGEYSAAKLPDALAPFGPDRMALLEEALERAQEAAGGVYRERVDFFGQGLFYPRLYREGMRIGEELREDRERMTVWQAAGDGTSRQLWSELPPDGKPALLREARELREREAAFLGSLTGSPALCLSSLQTTDRSYQGWMGVESVSCLAWKYWPEAWREARERSSVRVNPREREEAESRLEELRRGGNRALASRGVRVEVDSRYRPHFKPGEINDGRRRGAGWASEEGSRTYSPRRPWSEFPPHWLELEWPEPVTLEAIVVYWGERTAFWTSSAYELQSWRDGTWDTLVRVGGNPECRLTLHLFAPREVSRLRLWQAGDGGSPLRPNLMWVREVECYGRR